MLLWDGTRTKGIENRKKCLVAERVKKLSQSVFGPGEDCGAAKEKRKPFLSFLSVFINNLTQHLLDFMFAIYVTNYFFLRDFSLPSSNFYSLYIVERFHFSLVCSLDCCRRFDPVSHSHSLALGTKCWMYSWWREQTGRQEKEKVNFVDFSTLSTVDVIHVTLHTHPWWLWKGYDCKIDMKFIWEDRRMSTIYAQQQQHIVSIR